MYRVLLSEEFKKQVATLDPSIQLLFRKTICAIQVQPFTGKPLGLRFLREKKIKGLRLYFLIYDQYNIVLIAKLSNKKRQKEAIETLKKQLSAYAKEIRERIT